MNYTELKWNEIQTEAARRPQPRRPGGWPGS
jgi:hypothetical protein